MEGILGKIRGGIDGLLGNPFVQGVGGALAFGANPLLGLLVGSSLKSSRESRELNNDVLRQQLLVNKRRNEAIGGLTDLLGRDTTVQAPDRAAGLLDVGGGSPFEFNLPSRRESVPAIQTQAGQREAQGLLGQISPDNAAVSLLNRINPKQARTNVNLQSLNDFQRAVGRKATESEAQNIFGAASPNAAVQAQIAENRALLLKQQILDARDSSDRKRLEKEVEDATIDSAINSSLNTLSEMADINFRRGEGGLLAQPGVGSDVKQSIAQVGGLVAGAFGSPMAQQLNQIAQDNERFDQAADQLAITRLETGTFKASSDRRFQAWRSTKPSSKRSVATNNLTLADTIVATLATADSRKVTVPDRAKWDALVNKLRTSKGPVSVPTAPPLPFDPANAELVP